METIGRNDMDQPAQINALQSDLNRVIDRYRSEFDLTVAAAIGVLEFIKLDLYQEVREARDDD